MLFNCFQPRQVEAKQWKDIPFQKQGDGGQRFRRCAGGKFLGGWFWLVTWRIIPVTPWKTNIVTIRKWWFGSEDVPFKYVDVWCPCLVFRGGHVSGL